jgi:hypothetical protein
MNMKTLPDGREVDSSSEEWRHHCEAVTVLKMPLNARKAHLLAVEQKRGVAERQRLQGTLLALWIESQAKMLVDLNPAARMDRLQALRGDNGGHIVNKIEARTSAIENSRSGIAANDNKQPELFGT